MNRTVVGAVAVVAILVGAGVGFLAGSANERTVTSTTSAVSTVVFTSATTLTLTSTMATPSTSTVTERQTGAGTPVGVGSRWYGLMFMGNETGCAVSTDPPTTWYETPCFGSNADEIVFNCAAAAATTQGCTRRFNVTGVVEPTPSGPGYFVVTIWYPYVNASVYPGVNCKYTVPSVPTPPGPEGPGYAYCISVNATSFIVAVQAPGPA